MKRTFNLRFFLILLVIVVATVVGTYFLHQYQMKQQVRFYLLRAEQALQTKELPKAKEYFERYIMLQPKDVNIYNRYAMLVDDAATSDSRPERVRAYLSLEKALRQYASDKTLGDPPAELRKRAGSRALGLGRYKDAGEILEPLVLAKTTDIKVLELWAETMLKKGDDKSVEIARKQYRDIIDKDPKNFNSYKALKDIYLFQKNTNDARELMNEMLSKNSRSHQAHKIRADYFAALDAKKEAQEELDLALEYSNPNEIDADIVLTAATMALDTKTKTIAERQQKLAEAESYLSKGIKLHPKDARFYITKAQMEIGKRPPNLPAALELLKQAIPIMSANPNEQWFVAKLLLDAGEKIEATKLYESLRSKFGGTAFVEYLRARLLYLDNKVGEAVAIQERIKDGLAPFPEVAREAEVYLMQGYDLLGNPERRLAALERLLKIEAKPELQLKRADLLASMGRQKEALDLYQIYSSKVPGSRLNQIRLMLANELRKKQPQQDWNEVRTALEQCTAEEKQTKEHRLLRIQLLQITNNQAELEKTITQACAEQPKEIAFWLAKLAFINQQAGPSVESKQQASLQCLQDAEKAAGDHVELRLAKAFLILVQNRKDTLEALSKLEEGTEKFSAIDRANFQLRMSDLYQAIGYTKDAHRLLQKTLTANPNDLVTLERLVSIAQADQQFDEAQRFLKLMRDAEGEEGYQWRLATARGLLSRLQKGERSQQQETRKLIDEITRLRPGWHVSTTLQAQFLEATGQLDQAIEQYKRAIELGERNTDVVKKTVQLLAMRRRPQEAKEVLNATKLASMLGTLDADVTLLLSKNAQDKIATAKQKVKADSTDFREYLWLANVQWSNEDKDGAEAAFKKAVQLGSEYPETWANWICYLIDRDRQGEAAAELKRAEATLKDKFTYVQVAYHQALKQFDKAQEYYAKLVNENPTDTALFQGLINFHFKQGNFAQAESLLKNKLTQPVLDASTSNWLRRSFAMTLAMKGDYPSYQEALKIIEQNLKENSRSPEDLRTRALIQTTRTGSRENSIKDLETSFATLKPSATEARLLAQLYEEDGNWPKAAALLEKMVTDTDGDSPANLAYYVLAMVRNNQLDAASKKMDTLEDKVKEKKADEAFVVEPKSRLLMKKGEKQQVVEMLEGFASRAYAARKDPNVLLQVAALLEQLDIKDQAEKFIRRFVTETEAKTPASALALVAFLSRQGKTTDALNLCDQYSSRLPPAQLAMAMVSVANTSKPLKSELDRIETKVKALQAAHKDDTGVSFALANLLGTMKRPAQAETLYRELLQREQNNPVVLNNLAWLLSDRPEASKEALQYIDKAIELAGPEGALLDTRGMILVRMGKLNEAITDLKLAVEKAPDANHWLHLGYAQHQAKNSTDAQRSWQKAKGLKEENLSADDRLQYTTLKQAYSR
jgi:tetratricopeptide (TPR) repeat protein